MRGAGWDCRQSGSRLSSACPAAYHISHVAATSRTRWRHTMHVTERTTLAERTTDGHTRYDPTIIPPARVLLQPIAPPSILGLYGFAGATLIVAAHQAGLYGGSTSAQFLFPFAAFFGGLAQFMAGMWGYRARDGLATATHGMWGAFWMGYGVLQLLFAMHTLTEPTGRFPELGWWFIALAA